MLSKQQGGIMDYYFLSKSILFRGIAPDEIAKMLNCLQAAQKHFKKGAIIYRTGDIIQSMGLVLSGHVQIENDDFWGTKAFWIWLVREWFLPKPMPAFPGSR